ncbi:MAG: hypothetical protein P8R42_10550 [Candidatus Binatia bacterium]|nr:hypothetical protein [Candidatus Binatia bacterium]
MSISVSLLGPLFALVSVLSAVGLSHAEPEAPWITVSPPDEPFSVQMPGKPDRKTALTDTIVGDLTRVTFAFDEGGMELVVTRIDLPGVATFFMSDESLYQNVREGFLKGSDKTETSYGEAERAGWEGRRLEFTRRGGGPEREVRAEFFLVGDRMVTFMAVTPAGKSLSGLNRFLESISFKEVE